MSELDEYLEFAKELAYEAGEVMRRYFRADDIGTEWKQDNTPLTIADTAINDLVIKKVKTRLPNHGVWGEEKSYNHQANELWVCDPIDGTMPFSHGLPISSFSLGLVVGGKPIVGVIYDPFLDRLFWAAKGQGAYINDKKIHVSSKDNLKNALIELSNLPPSGPETIIKTEVDFARKLNLLGAHTTHLWSVALPMALIASGQYIGAVFNLNLLQDVVAAKVIIEEAGGKVTDLDGNDQKYNKLINGFIASNGKIHDQLVDLVASLKGKK